MEIKLIIREGEQHDLMLFVSDFLEYYRMSTDSALQIANVVFQRLPAVALQIPVSIQTRRQINIRFSSNDNITKVIEAFTDFYDLDGGAKLQITKMARAGMAPGTFII